MRISKSSLYIQVVIDWKLESSRSRDHRPSHAMLHAGAREVIISLQITRIAGSCGQNYFVRLSPGRLLANLNMHRVPINFTRHYLSMTVSIYFAFCSFE